MGKHRRPGPLDQPSRAVPRPDRSDPFLLYQQRRREPADGPRRHHSLQAGSPFGTYDPHILEEWDGYRYRPAGIAPDLVVARAWAGELLPDDSDADR